MLKLDNDIKNLEDIVFSRLQVAEAKGHDLGIFISYKIDREAFENSEDVDKIDLPFGYSTLKVDDDIEIKVFTAVLEQLIQRSGANKKQLKTANDIIFGITDSDK